MPGIYLPGSAYGEDDGNLESLMAVNVCSAYRLSRLLLPAMMEARNGPYIQHVLHRLVERLSERRRLWHQQIRPVRVQ